MKNAIINTRINRRMSSNLMALCLMTAYQPAVLAADAVAKISPTGSILKMVLGLAAVLAVMALVSWGVKRLLPNAVAQNSTIKVVGGVSVGSRERVVVLEVAGRWLVVGVAQGQVSAIADLDAGADVLVSSVIADKTTSKNSPVTKPFSEWLKRSADSAKDKLANK